MSIERIQKVFRRNGGYAAQTATQYPHRRHLTQPLEAVVLDSVEITDNSQDDKEPAASLISLIKNMPDHEVAQRMKQYRDSFATIDDALVDKIILETI